MKAKFKVGDKVKITNDNKVYGGYKNSFILNSVSNKLFKMFESGYIPHNNTFADVVAVGKHELGNNIYFIKENGHVSIIGESGLELVETVTDEITINRYGNKVVAKMGKKVGAARCNTDDTFDLYTGVKIAVDRLFGKESEFKNSEVKEVKRRAKVGEYIKITNSLITCGKYKNGDVLKVERSYKETFYKKESVYVGEPTLPILTSEYVVLENYKPQEKPQEEKPKYYNGKVVCVDNALNVTRYTTGKIYTFKGGKMINSDDGIILPNTFVSFEQFNKWSSSKFIELVEDK